MEKIKLSSFDEYKKFLLISIELLNKIHKIMLIALNDLFFDDHLSFLKDNIIIKDTIEILIKSNFDLNILFNDELLFENYQNLQNNSFIEISKLYQNIINNKLIKKINKKPSRLNISKKNYEVEILSPFILEEIDKHQITTIIEMGCGKSYLTEILQKTNKIIYIGIDKNDNLLSNNKDNTLYYNLNIDSSFNNYYNKIIKPELAKKLVGNQKIMIFGLHACGNLTSDALKIFLNNDDFKNIAVIGCCLHLLTEYISETAKYDISFKEHLSNIGYDNKGNFLDDTLIYENNDCQGYPLSNLIMKECKDLFLTRTMRKASMQTFPENKSKIINIDEYFYKTKFFRTLFQVYLKIYVEELDKYYGYGKVEYDINNDDIFINFQSFLLKNYNKLNNQENKVGEKFLALNLKNYNLILNKYKMAMDDEINLKIFFNKYYEYRNILWACFAIRMKFSRLIEIIVLLDRIVFICENGITDVGIYQIFDLDISKRNFLIYANKN